MLYAIWACGTWCTEGDICEYLTFMSDDYAVLDTEDFWHPEYEGLKALLGCEQADSLLEELNVERPNAPRSEPYNCCEPAEPVYALPVNDAYWDDIPF